MITMRLRRKASQQRREPHAAELDATELDTTELDATELGVVIGDRVAPGRDGQRGDRSAA
jgi:hypothetical protein